VRLLRLAQCPLRSTSSFASLPPGDSTCPIPHRTVHKPPLQALTPTLSLRERECHSPFAIRHSPILPLATRCSPLAVPAIRYSPFANDGPYPNPLPKGEGVPFAIRYSPFAIRRSYHSPLAARRSPRKPQPLSCFPLPTRSPLPMPPGQFPNFSHLIQQMVLDTPNPNS
jgi:hypothetical protein